MMESLTLQADWEFEPATSDAPASTLMV